MALSSLASTDAEPLVLTIDGAELIAHDASSMTWRWTTSCGRPLRGVVYAAPGVLPSASSPWRSAASSSMAVVVDDRGTLHLIDATIGREVSAVGPFGEPVALAAEGTSIALAAGRRVRVWHEGVLAEIDRDATALAFGHGQLAIAHARSLDVYEVATRRVIKTERTVGDVHAVAPHWLAGDWLVGVGQGLLSGERRLTGGDVRRIAVNTRQRRVAVQRTSTHVAVFRASFDLPELRVKYTDRVVAGLALVGPRVAIGLDHGDANTIHLGPRTKSEPVTRTSRSPERAWAPELGPDPFPPGR